MNFPSLPKNFYQLLMILGIVGITFSLKYYNERQHDKFFEIHEQKKDLLKTTQNQAEIKLTSANAIIKLNDTLKQLPYNEALKKIEA